MDFVKPEILYLLFVIPVLLLLYILKLRRKTQIVSSTLLWEQAIEDIKANTLFQRLRRNLLLPLQVLFLMLLIFALARPFIRGLAGISQNSILVIDSSASMKATDIGESRFDEAKSTAIRIVDGLRDGNRMMIIKAESTPKIVAGFTHDKLSLKDTIRKMRASDTPAKLDAGINLALSIAKDIGESEIFILSDGAFKLQTSFANTEIPLHFIGFGKKDAENVGITTIELVKGQTGDKSSVYQAFLAIQNFGQSERRRMMIELYHDNNLIDVREFNLLPQERRSFIFDNIRHNEGVIKAVVETDDDLDIDNRAFYILHSPKPFEILMVSRGNLFLQRAIETVSDKISLSVHLPEAYPITGDYDIIVFDEFIPDDLPDRNMIIINPESTLPFGKLLSRMDNPAVIDWDKTHQIMRFVDISNLKVDRAWGYQMPFWMEPLVESNMGVLIWSGEYRGNRIIVLTFDTQFRSSNNFAMLSAFPIFISNALDWLAGIEQGLSRWQIKSGETARIPFPDTPDQSVKIQKPDGREVEARIEGKRLVFQDTDQVGIYEINGEGIKASFAVNLLDENESSIKAMDSIEIGNRKIASSSFSTVSNKEIWSFLILLAILLLAIEWWVYHRRVLV